VGGGGTGGNCENPGELNPKRMSRYNAVCCGNGRFTETMFPFVRYLSGLTGAQSPVIAGCCSINCHLPESTGQEMVTSPFVTVAESGIFPELVALKKPAAGCAREETKPDVKKRAKAAAGKLGRQRNKIGLFMVFRRIFGGHRMDWTSFARKDFKPRMKTKRLPNQTLERRYLTGMGAGGLFLKNAGQHPIAYA